MLSHAEAITKIRANATKLGSEDVVLQDIPGRILAQSLAAPIDHQPFDNSTMDGFAVRTEGFTTTQEVVGQVAAGDLPREIKIQPGQCLEIMTGAPIPKGCDAVIPVEETDRRGKNVVFKTMPVIGRFIRRQGQDIKKDTVLLPAGTFLKEQHILPLAALGVGKIKAIKRSRVAFISTGPELVDDLSQALVTGQIYNATGIYLRTMLPQLGAEVVFAKTIQDDPGLFLQSVKEAQERGTDIIISTGAVSMGAHDFIHGSLQKMGADILFHKIKIRPGKPNLFARLPDKTLFFGLPGNPVSTACGIRFFVYEAIRAMNGQMPEDSYLQLAMGGWKSPGTDFTFFLKAKKHGEKVEILPGQDSFMISPFLDMNSWVMVPGGVSEIKAGDSVATYPLIPYN